MTTRSPEQIARLMQHVREGSFEITAMHFSLQTDLTGPEELVRSLYFSDALAWEYGFDVKTAVTNDTPGFTWSLAQILNKADIPYFSVAMNSFLSEFYRTTDLPNLFYWEGQSGDRTLVWRSIHEQLAYLEGNVWGVYGVYGTMEQRLTNLLNSLADGGYPYDFVLINAATGDNGAPIISISTNAGEWNSRHDHSEMRVATFSEFFDYAVSTGVDIPVFSGDAPNWWSWSFATSATGGYLRSREAQVKLPAAEAAATIASELNPEFQYPKRALERAYVDNLLFEDHNLGAASNRPFEENLDFWELKMDWVNGAADTAEAVKSRAIDAWASVIHSDEPASVAVFNLTPWMRTDIATITVDQLAAAGLGAVQVYDPITDNVIPTQYLHSGDLVFLAADVPSFGFRRFGLQPVLDTPPPSTLTGPDLENEFMHVTADPTSGGLTSVYDKELEVELATGNGRFAQYLLNGSGIPQTSEAGSDSGAVLQRLVLEGTAPASSAYRTEIVLPAHEKRVDIVATWDKDPVSVTENVDFRFDLALPDATLDYEIPFGHVTVFEDELEGFQSNHYGWLRWSEVNSPAATAVIATTGAGVHAYSSGAFNGNVRLLTSWNGAGTAYRAGVGELQSAFSITTRDSGNAPAASTKFAYRFNHPLETRILPAQSGPIKTPVYSFLEFLGDDVYVSTLKQPSGWFDDGYILRIYNPSEQTAHVTLRTGPDGNEHTFRTNILEFFAIPLGSAGKQFELTLAPFEIRTLLFSYRRIGSASAVPVLADELRLEAPWPNPTSLETNFDLELGSPARVQVDVFDVLGRKVETVSNRFEQAGDRTLTWRPNTELANGVYLISVEGTFADGSVATQTKTVTLAR
jgi:hypothetical protein